MLEALAKKPFRELLEMASRTQTSSNIRPLRSLDQLANSVVNLTQAVVDAQCTRDRLVDSYNQQKAEAEAYLEKLKSEFEKEITAAEIALNKATTERRKAQWRTIRQQIDMGVFEGAGDLGQLARSKEFKSEAE